jgi:hypothetical protein
MAGGGVEGQEDGDVGGDGDGDGGVEWSWEEVEVKLRMYLNLELVSSLELFSTGSRHVI